MCLVWMQGVPDKEGTQGPLQGEGHFFHCTECLRSFVSSEALQQHIQNSPAHRQTAVEENTSPQGPRIHYISPLLLDTLQKALVELSAEAAAEQPKTPYPAPALTHHLANKWTHLAPSDHPTILAQLLRHCHSPSRLTTEGYALAPTATTVPTPRRPSLSPKRKAVVLDCEMAGAAGLPDQVVSLSLIDFTGQPLINTLVQPAGGVHITEWRSQTTGITPAKMAAAAVMGEVLRGKEAAVAALSELVGGDTVIVGHTLRNDLRALGVVHGRIVDVGIVAAVASRTFTDNRKISGMVGLERLCRELAGVRIREGGEGVHDSLEDVLAAREVMIWYLAHPRELWEWARKIWPPDYSDWMRWPLVC